MVSASCALASCSGRQIGGHLYLHCVPKIVRCRCYRLRMTGRIGLHHRDSRGTDTSHISESKILTTFSSSRRDRDKHRKIECILAKFILNPVCNLLISNNHACGKRIQKAIDKFISSLVNRLDISYLCLKIERILCQYSSSLKKKSSLLG